MNSHAVDKIDKHPDCFMLGKGKKARATPETGMALARKPEKIVTKIVEPNKSNACSPDGARQGRA